MACGFTAALRSARFFALSRAELERRAVPYAVISGSGETRFENALTAIAQLS